MIKFQCCHCDQPIEAPEEMLHMEVDCPACGKKVKVLPMKEVAIPPKPDEAVVRYGPGEKIERIASAFAGAAAWFAIAGVVVAFVCLCNAISGQDANTGFIISGGLVAAALWFYLTAQIVHIRALLSKK